MRKGAGVAKSSRGNRFADDDPSPPVSSMREGRRRPGAVPAGRGRAAATAMRTGRITVPRSTRAAQRGSNPGPRDADRRRYRRRRRTGRPPAPQDIDHRSGATAAASRRSHDPHQHQPCASGGRHWRARRALRNRKLEDLILRPRRRDRLQVRRRITHII